MTGIRKISDLRGAILIGGRSKRMGAPKSMLRLRGRFVLERIADAIAPAVGEIVLIGDAPVPPPMETLPKLPDPPGVEGPAAGILAALRYAPEAWWLAVSCDLPLISPEAVTWLVEHADLRAPAVMPHLENPRTAEPLFALYAPTAAGIIEQAVASGERAPRRMFSRVRIASPKIPAHLRVAWTNVNTPEEWMSAATVALEKDTC